MPKLENPVESPCFGCGPKHTRGLRLSFERRGRQVVCIHTPRKDEVGWPGYMHPGLHFMVLRETSYWGALELGGKVHGAGITCVFRMYASPPVNVPFRTRSRIVKRTRRGLHIVAVSESLSGKRRYGMLQTTYLPAKRSFVRRAGLQLPDYLLSDMDP
ncbi:MAG TPA: hypothetical protein VMU35_09420 [Methylomirabilota bacterium]|nr:hypothetical protein [Methylomirabilota bacterium]